MTVPVRSIQMLQGDISENGQRCSAIYVACAETVGLEMLVINKLLLIANDWVTYGWMMNYIVLLCLMYSLSNASLLTTGTSIAYVINPIEN
jgi:hypothetical protein